MTDRNDLLTMARVLTEADAPVSESQVDFDATTDAATWSAVAQIGLPGLLVPARHGGSAGSLNAAAVVLEELGRSLSPAPLLGHLVASRALSESVDSFDVGQVLTELADGSRRAAISIEPANSETALRSVGGRLTGLATGVLGGSGADWLVVQAHTCSGAALYLLDLQQPNVVVRPHRRQVRADIFLAGVPAQWFAGAASVARLRAVATILLGARQIGGATAALASCEQLLVEAAAGPDRDDAGLTAARSAYADISMQIASARNAVSRGCRDAAAPLDTVLALASTAHELASSSYVQAAQLGIALRGLTGRSGDGVFETHMQRALIVEHLLGAGDTRPTRSTIEHSRVGS